MTGLRGIAGSICLAAACGGGSQPHESPMPGDFDVAMCTVPAGFGSGDPCEPPWCGGTNSPIANTFPINGLSITGRGECNPGGVQLIPRSLHGGGCRSGADLTLEAGRLVGKRGGAIVCAGDQLTGATFAVRSPTATVVLTIANVRRFDRESTRYEGYRVELGGASVCEEATARRTLHDLGFGRATWSERATPRASLTGDGYTLGFDDDLVIALGGPLYDTGDRTIAAEPNQWFSLACAGDSLAKRTFYHLVSTNPEDNETALRMLTANYCGKPYTVRGVEIKWTQDARPLVHEATWQAGKATCLANPRLMSLMVGGERLQPQQLPAHLQPTGCAGAGDGAPGTCNKDQWIEALRQECALPACPETTGTTSLESYIDALPGNLVQIDGPH